MHNKKNVIVIGGGGGNDIFSATVYIHHLEQQYNFEKIALAGVLGFTPFHSNSIVCELKTGTIHTEQPLIQPTENFARYLMYNPPRKIRNTEHILPKVCKEFIPFIENRYVCISSKYSPKIQAKNLQNQLNEWGMSVEDTLVIVVDFGGDILTDGNQDSIISPGLDAYTLSIVHYMPNLSYVTVCFPGVDGELDVEYLSKLCKLNKEKIEPSLWLTHFQNLFEYFKNIRPGNTIPNMINILTNLQNKNNEDFDILIKKGWRIGDQVINHEHKMNTNIKIQRFIYTFKLEDIVKQNIFCYLDDDYTLIKMLGHIMEIYKKQGKQGYQSSDFHLQYLRKDSNGQWSSKQLSFDFGDVLFVNMYPSVLNAEEIENVSKDIPKIKTNKVFTQELTDLYSEFYCK